MSGRAIDRIVHELRRAPLSELSFDARAAHLATVAGRLRAMAEDPTSLRTLAASSGLSPEMVAWAIRTTFADATYESFAETARVSGLADPNVRPAALHAIALSGNVLTAPARPILLSLLFGVPVMARASRREHAFARILVEQVRAVSGVLADGLACIDLAPDDPAFSHFLNAAPVLSAYGSDETLLSIRRQVHLGTLFIPHGHGLGVAYVPAAANQTEDDADAAAHALALDIAAYDQRGCLSPHVCYVEAGGRVDPQHFAARLFEALGALARRLPRGQLPTDVAAQQLQFRGTGAALGRLFEGDGYAITYEGELPPRPCPGYRNLAVHTVSDEVALFEHLSRLGRHLKVLGVAGDASLRSSLAERIPSSPLPRVAPLGHMQTPSFTGPWDSLPPWHGLLRYASVG